MGRPRKNALPLIGEMERHQNAPVKVLMLDENATYRRSNQKLEDVEWNALDKVDWLDLAKADLVIIKWPDGREKCLKSRYSGKEGWPDQGEIGTPEFPLTLDVDGPYRKKSNG